MKILLPLLHIKLGIAKNFLSRQDFDQVLTERQLKALLTLKAVIKGLLGKERNMLQTCWQLSMKLALICRT